MIRKLKCAHDGQVIRDDEPYVIVHHADSAVPVKLDNLPLFGSEWAKHRSLRFKAEELARREIDPEEMSPAEYSKALSKLTDRKVAELREAIASSSAAKAKGEEQ